MTVLESLLRLMHPLIPFITEEIWHKVAPLTGKAGKTVMLEPYPAPEEFAEDAKADEEVAWLKEFVLGVRSIRGEIGIADTKRFGVLLADASPRDREYAERHSVYLESLASLDGIELLPAGDQAPQSATALLGSMKILVPMAGLIDKEAETARLSREIEKRSRDLGKSEQKLSNENFVNNAPAAVVEKERARVAELGDAIEQLERQLAKVRDL